MGSFILILNISPVLFSNFDPENRKYKSTMAVLKLELNTQEIIEHFFEGSKLLGIVTTVKDYRFCWNLNNMLGINFRINHDFEIKLERKGRQYFFSVYEYHEPNSTLCHYLYNNLHDGEYLLPEFKNLDFLWLMKNDTITEEYLRQIKTMLLALPEVQLTTELTNEKIKNKEYLIF